MTLVTTGSIVEIVSDLSANLSRYSPDERLGGQLEPKENAMSIRTSTLALAAIATVAASLASTSASAFAIRPVVRIYHPFWHGRVIPPGVLPCKCGIVYVCQ